MKKSLILILMLLSTTLFISCANKEKQEINESSQLQNNTTEEDNTEVNDSEDSFYDTTLNDYELEEESSNEENNDEIDQERYVEIKSILENNKMSIESDSKSKLVASNGIGEKFVYESTETDIELNYFVPFNNILNEGVYDITGTVLNNIINIILKSDNQYTFYINKAIEELYANEYTDYTVEIDNLEITIKNDYEFTEVIVIITP